MKQSLSPHAKVCGIILGCFLFCHHASAQYVTIPDTAFVNWLKGNGYVSCFNGNQLDTTCSTVLSAHGVNCFALPIHDLTGIQYFKNLDTLDCSNDSLYFIPQLPVALIFFNCAINNLNSLPVLPATLVTLKCDHNPLHSLPALSANLSDIECSFDLLISLPSLPASLNSLYCVYNQITSLPVLPSNLKSLICDYNLLTNLPTLPATLTWLECGTNQITSLPALPPALFVLQCNNNRLTSLPALPATLNEFACNYNMISNMPALPAALVSFYCNNNQLSSLPPLPPHLAMLEAAYNQLTNLPALPSTLTHLGCRYNQLTSLPALPAMLYQITCDSNHLTSLPALPDSLGFLYCDSNANLTCLPELKRIVSLYFNGTAITCLPNYGQVTNSNPPLSTVPLCGIYNPAGCQPFWNISGQCFYDENNDCQFDSIDAGTNYVKTQLYNGNTLIQQTFTGGEGFYSFDSVPYGNYTIQVDTSGLPFAISCPVSNYNTVALSIADSISYSNNFGFKCSPRGFDLGVQYALNNYGIPRPNDVFSLHTVAGDMSQLYGAHCAAGISGQVQIVYSGQMTYVGPEAGAITPTSITGNTITWAIADFGTVNDIRSFNLLFKTDSLATPGTPLCFNISVTPATGDYNPANNTLSYCFPVVNALDPNEKEVYPAGNTDTSNHWLTYTIRYQNTGSAPAVNVRITDRLDSNLDPSTFQLLAYSAKNLTQIFGNDVVFNFPNINLPDSTTSDSASRGYVQYKIKLLNDLPPGTQIQNTADIYFDLNPAVVTNTTVNTITLATSIIPVSVELNLQLYPNPAKNYVIVETDESAIGAQLQITDITGREIAISRITNLRFQISTSTLTAGVYFVKVSDNLGRITVKKLVVE